MRKSSKKKNIKKLKKLVYVEKIQYICNEIQYKT